MIKNIQIIQNLTNKIWARRLPGLLTFISILSNKKQCKQSMFYLEKESTYSEMWNNHPNFVTTKKERPLSF